ncbi:YrzE family protein [Caballeronia sp. INML1]|uniref:YrzE family protein n=1 Tax=Caballeronia sp. INML1 TaxID=2921760 RepID=UPI0020296C3B|nr:YrzE family protein [Caballeronia sp. INML1]
MKLLTTRDGLPRLSWASIIAGVILSMVVYLIMSVLGTAIGASLLSPMSKPDPLHGFGFGSGVWVIVTTVLAVFVGSYYAGRCAPVLGWLHGLLSWAVMTLLIVYGMTSLITGAVSTAGSVAATTAPQAEQTARETADTAARGVARASWFSFAALVVGAIIAIVSGGAGFRHQPPFEESAGTATGVDPSPGRNRAVPRDGRA